MTNFIKPINQTITITLGDVAENHAGMQRIGNIADEGFTLEDLKNIKIKLKTIGIECKIITLKNPNADESNGYLLVAKNAVDKLLNTIGNYTNEMMFEEQLKIQFDKKALMRGKVVNKHARWNVCYDKKSQKSNYSEGKGTVIAYKDIPITKSLIDIVPEYFGEKAVNLKGEGNYYYDTNKCGIGYHGDSERKKVIAIRLGTSLPIYYQWYHKNNPIGMIKKIELNSGDMYVMSEKAVGYDWKKSSLYTLRHATGCDKYTNI